MKPESTKATGRVKSPTAMSAPPTRSSTPAKPISENSGNGSGKYSDAGQAKSFCVPCGMNRSPVIIRSAASA